MRDPSKAASAATQQAVQGTMWLLAAVGIFFVSGNWKISGLWLLLAIGYIGLAWRTSRKQRRHRATALSTKT
jgi:chromate transport protein ChrA